MDAAEEAAPATEALSGPPEKQEISGDLREVQAVARILTAIAIEEYGYVPQAPRSPIPNEIRDITQRAGIPVSPDTIRKYLQIGSKHLQKE